MRIAITYILTLIGFVSIGQDYRLIHDGWPWSSAYGVMELESGNVIHFGYKDARTRVILSYPIGGPIWKAYPKDTSDLVGDRIIFSRVVGDSVEVIYESRGLYRGDLVTGKFVFVKDVITTKQKPIITAAHENKESLFIAGADRESSIVYRMNKAYEIVDSTIHWGYILDIESSETNQYTLSWKNDTMIVESYWKNQKVYERLFTFPAELKDIEPVGDELLIAGTKGIDAYIGVLNEAGEERQLVLKDNADNYEAFWKIEKLDRGNIGVIYKDFYGGLGQLEASVIEYSQDGEELWSTKLDISNTSIYVNDLVKSRRGTMLIAGEAGSLDVGSRNWAFVAETEKGAVRTIELNKPEAIIFPNPTTGEFFVKSESQIWRYELYDHLGTQRLSQTGSAFNISQLPIGVYTLKIIGKSTECRQIVKY